jgi:hypothetical protein
MGGNYARVIGNQSNKNVLVMIILPMAVLKVPSCLREFKGSSDLGTGTFFLSSALPPFSLLSAYLELSVLCPANLPAYIPCGSLLMVV